MMPMAVPANYEPLFIHGFAGGAGHWDEVRDLLDPACRGVALDLAGHGAHPKAVSPYTVERCARDVIDRLPRAGALLVGHSMGTRIALETATRAPDLVRGLVLVDGSNAPADPAIVANELRSAIRQRGATGAMTEIMRGFLLDGLIPVRRAELLRQAVRLPADAAIAYWESMAAWDATRFADCLKQVSSPVIVLQSTSLVENAKLERHPIEDVPHSRWLDAWYCADKAQIIRVPHCGHYIMIERPDVVANAVTSALLRA